MNRDYMGAKLAPVHIWNSLPKHGTTPPMWNHAVLN